MPIKEPPVERLPLFKETPKRSMTVEEIAKEVCKRMKETGHNLQSSLFFIMEDAKIDGATQKERTEKKQKLKDEVMKFIESSIFKKPIESLNSTPKEKPPIIESSLKKTIPFDSKASIAFAAGLEKRDPKD